MVYDYKSDKAHNLNVVYFVPNDVTEPEDYHRRLSEILYWQPHCFFYRLNLFEATDTRIEMYLPRTCLSADRSVAILVVNFIINIALVFHVVLKGSLYFNSVFQAATAEV